jgi:hypothetical protein
MKRWALGFIAVLAASGPVPVIVPAASLSVAMGVPAGVATASERDATPPDGSGSVPQYRTDGPALLVCGTDLADFTKRIAEFPADLITANLALWDQCQASGFRTLQEAVDHATAPGANIKILPGVYQEQPSLADPTKECSGLPETLSYDQQVACPHDQNLVAVLGKQNLQIEGTGKAPEDVVLDAQYRKANAIRADRSSGIYLRNFTAEHTTSSAVYVMESDGFVIDHMTGRWNNLYGFLTFTDDHGLYTDCEAYGNGDAGLDAKATSNINALNGYDTTRYAVEIKNCYSHDNLIGYAGTAGDSVWAHDSRFLHNSVGVATDSAVSGLPGLPQNHALFEHNVIGDNDAYYYGSVQDGTCAKPSEQRGYDQGVVCPAVGVPPGTGVFNPGGDYNTWRDNWVYGNAYAGFVTSWVPGFFRGDHRIGAQFDTSHHNRYYDNHLGLTPDGSPEPNGMDYWWDGQGVSSCWQDASGAGSSPKALPACNADNLPTGLSSARYLPEPGKLLTLYVCSGYDASTGHLPSGCSWYGAHGIGRMDVQFAVGEALVLAAVLIAVWWRVLRRYPLGFVGMLVALAGLVVGVLGTARPATLLTPVGLGLLGVGWALCGAMLYQRKRPGLGFLTVALGLLALAGAVDQGIYTIPYIPVPPSVWRMVLEVFWVLAAAVAAVRSHRRRRAADSKPRPTRDALESFTARLASGSW